MRKVTASAVILTALTGCGQNGSIPSTQWSFEIPTEDEISSLELDRSDRATADADWVSTVDDSVLTGDRGLASLSPASGNAAATVMGPAFEQPGADLKTVTASSSSSSSAGLMSGYQPLSSRPDPVAQVKAFLSASGNPTALTNREPYRSDVLVPSLPTINLPTPVDITATLGDPAGIELSNTAPGSDSFTYAGLPVVDALAGEEYRTDNGSTLNSTAAAVPAAGVELSSSLSTDRSAIAQPIAMVENGLPMLEPRAAENSSIGTAILQDLQAAATTEPTSVLPADAVAQAPVSRELESNALESNALSSGELNNGIAIEIWPAEADDTASALVVDASDASNLDSIETAATDSSSPTLESLQRSIASQNVTSQGRSPLLVSSLPRDKTALAVEELAIETVAYSNPQADFPTLRNLLETMPKTAAQANFEPGALDSSDASPLLEGLRTIEPLSTLYIPIPEATSEAGADTGLMANANLVRGSLASLSKIVAGDKEQQGSSAEALRVRTSQVANLRGDRNKAILSLVDKPVSKRHRLMTY